jgi:fibronectin type 3 domain-containing protein
LRKPGGGILGILIVSTFLAACGYKTSPRPATATVPGEVGLTDARVYPDRVVLRWQVPLSNVDGSKLTDISGFKVYRASQKTGEECENCEEKKIMHSNVDYQNPTAAVIADGAVTYTDKDVSPGNVYFYSVSVYNLKGREGRPSQDMTVQLTELPQAPEGLRAVAESGGVALQWTSGSQGSGIQGYRVYRGTTDKIEDMKAAGRTSAGDTTFFDKDVEKEKTYYYVVRSFRLNRGVSVESPASPVSTITVSSSDQRPPENVRAEAQRDGIRIVWDEAQVPGQETRYNVYRSESGRRYEKINTEPIRSTWFLDRNTVKGRTYRYTVAAFQEGNPQEETSRSASPAVEYKP